MRNLVAMCEGLDSYVRSCAQEPFSEDLCRQSMYKFLEALSALNRLWRENIPQDQHKYMPFHLRQKCHLLQQLVEDKTPMWGVPLCILVL